MQQQQNPITYNFSNPQPQMQQSVPMQHQSQTFPNWSFVAPNEDSTLRPFKRKSFDDDGMEPPHKKLHSFQFHPPSPSDFNSLEPVVPSPESNFEFGAENSPDSPLSPSLVSTFTTATLAEEERKQTQDNSKSLILYKNPIQGISDVLKLLPDSHEYFKKMMLPKGVYTPPDDDEDDDRVKIEEVDDNYIGTPEESALVKQPIIQLSEEDVLPQRKSSKHSLFYSSDEEEHRADKKPLVSTRVEEIFDEEELADYTVQRVAEADEPAVATAPVCFPSPETSPFAAQQQFQFTQQNFFPTEDKPDETMELD